jgi:hypothetical protein
VDRATRGRRGTGLGALEDVGRRAAVDGRRRGGSGALLAYCPAQLLAQVPLTPGGLGVVEAGMTGTRALAGVPAAAAAVATLAYRLASYWRPLPVWAGDYVAHRRRFGAADELIRDAEPAACAFVRRGLSHRPRTARDRAGAACASR